MDNTTQKKRGSRSGKASTQQQQQSSDAFSTASTDNIDISKNVQSANSPKEDLQNTAIADASLNITDGSSIATSPTSGSPIDSALAGTSAAAECRRSSRKKIIKFDVRDLLNKNRKPHKIQIEARIDSNAPASSNAMLTGQSASSSSPSIGGSCANVTAASTADLTSKQKTFIEKSAIFRRYSISEQQNKINIPPPRPPLPPPVSKISLLNKNIDSSGSDASGDNLPAPIQIPMDPIKMAQARRLSRTQEIFNASMMKSKQNSSLIVAQMESSSSSSGSITTPLNLSPLTQRRTATTMSAGKRKVVVTKLSPAGSVSGRKNILENAINSALLSQDSKMQKRRGRPPKNKTMGNDNQLDKNLNSKTTLNEGQKSIPINTTSTELPTAKLTPEKATNWKEYKECLKAKEKRTQVDVGQNEIVKSTFSDQPDDVVLEISSSDSELEELHSPTSESSSSIKEANQSPTKQRKFAALSFIQEAPSTVSDNKSAAPEFIVAAVEEILSDCPVAVDNPESTPFITESTIEENTEMISCSTESASTSSTNLASKEAPIIEGKLTRTSSGSESETNSDRSNKSYKLRVSLKRLSAKELSPNKDKTQFVPSSPTTSVCSSASSTRNSFSENSATSSKDTGEVQVKQTKKRSKRLQMKSEQMSVTSTSTASEAENDENATKIKDNVLPVVVKRTREQTKQKNVSKEAQIVDELPQQTMDVMALEKEKNLEASALNIKDKIVIENVVEKTIDISNKNLKENQTDTKAEVVQEAGQKALVVAHEDSNNKNSVTEIKAYQSVQLLEESKISSLKVIPEESINITIEDETKIESPSTAEDESTNVKVGKTSKRQAKQINETRFDPETDKSELVTQFSEEIELTPNLTNETKSETVTGKQEVEVEVEVENEQLIQLPQIKENPNLPKQLQKLKTLDDIKGDSKISILPEEKKVITPKKQKLKNIEKVNAIVEEKQPAISEKTDIIVKIVLQQAETTITSKEPLESNVSISTVKPIAIQTDVEGTQDSSTKLGTISKITEQVSVETKTLLDILKTVQTNEKAAAAAAVVEIAEKPTTTTATKIIGSKKRNSPARSETSSPQEVKKPIRRYERRSKRGEETTHKTLEETFAEIAAQSSKEILEMAAALETHREEIESDEEQDDNNIVTETTLIKCDLVTLNDKPDVKNTAMLSQTNSICAETVEKQMSSKEETTTIGDSNIQTAEVLNTKLIEDTTVETKEMIELKPEKVSEIISNEDISEPKKETEAEDLNKEIDNKHNISYQEKLKEDTKTDARAQAKRGRKPKNKQNETTETVETVEAKTQTLMEEENQNTENNTKELDKPSETETPKKTFEPEIPEIKDKIFVIQKDSKKSKKYEKIIQTTSEAQTTSKSVEDNLRVKESQEASIITNEKVFEVTESAEESVKQKESEVEQKESEVKQKESEVEQKESEVEQKEYEVEQKEFSDIHCKKCTLEANVINVDIQSNIKISEELPTVTEETKAIEELENKEGNLKILEKLTELEKVEKFDDTNELKEITKSEKTINTPNNNKKSKKSEKISKPTEALEKFETSEKKLCILDKTFGGDTDLQSAQPVDLKETSEKVKPAKKVKKSEDILKAKEEETSVNEKLESGEKTTKLKKPGKILKKEESVTDENATDTKEILGILDKRIEGTTNTESLETHELQGTDTIFNVSSEDLNTTEKTNLTPKIPVDVIKSTLNEKSKSADKVENTPKLPPKKRLFKTKSDTELIKSDNVENLSHSVDTSQTKEIKETTKKAKKTLKFKDSSIKTKAKAAKNIVKQEEDATSLESNKTPPKRGGKLKLKQSEVDMDTSASTSSGKKKGKKSMEDTPKVNKSSPKSLEKNKEKSLVKKSEKKKFLENENNADIACKTIEEKTSKKKRQKKLKEAFEAALKEEPVQAVQTKDIATELRATSEISEHAVNPDINPDTSTPEKQSPPPLYNLPLTPTNLDLNSPKASELETQTQQQEVQPTIIEPEEEDPDPLKDIEKFIEDGVNLLKRGYKIEDDDSVDEMLCAPSKTVKEDLRNKLILSETDDDGDKINNSKKEINDLPPVLSEITSFADTPADTPLATPLASPSKSPVPETTPDDSYASGVRRSHRIKQNKTPKALVGRGLVRDKERFSLKDDMETKTHYTIDDHRMDLAEVEAKNAKFLKDMEERLSNFLLIKENEYKCERIISREARKMICDCFLTADEEGRGELACGEDCLNRLLMIECGPDCNVKDRCTNKRFQKFLCSPCRVFRTEKKGFGIMADIEILPGEFIMEYVGEVINGEEFENRRIMYSQDKNRHYYFMALRSDAIIDATSKGNISRFINHSCDPNAETQKWTVNGELRIGFFSRKSIMPGEEITFDYQYQRYGREAQRCYCESSNCRGWIGEEPNSDEGEQIDDESDEENLAESLLEDDDEDDSDETEDAEEAQKKLEIAAAEAKLMPIMDDDKKDVDEEALTDEKQKREHVPDSIVQTDEQKENEEDSKSKFKKLLSKMAEKVAKKKKQKERKQRKELATNADSTKHIKPRYLEDPDIEDEVHFLSRCGLKNQSDTLRLSRLMVRAKLVQTRLNLLKILRTGDLPCRRLFLDYHGLRLLHGWMSEDGGDLKIRMALLETLETLPIANKTMLTDSKVFQTVRIWCGGTGSSADNSLSPSDESSKESSSSNNSNNNSSATQQEVPGELQKLATKLTAAWDSLPEIFRIPKKERIEQMKEHEREADRQYAAIATQEEESRRNTAFPDRYQRDRFGRGPPGSNNANRFAWTRGVGGAKDPRNISTLNTTSSNDPRRRSGNEIVTHTAADNTKHLSKEQRREMFAAKVARDEAEKRLAEERREFETKCRFFGLDPKKTRPQNLPFCVNPTTGQWYSAERQPISTPPTYAHVQVPVKPKSTNPDDYQLPPCAMNLSQKWKFAITPQGKIYYYHVQLRVPQWEPPSIEQLYGNSASGGVNPITSDSDTDADVNDSTDDDDEIIKGMDATKLQAYVEKKIEIRRQHRYGRLVDERPISPRREEDRIYNQMEVRKYKENKEKIRKRKEEIRRKRVEAVKNSTLNMCTLGSLDEPSSTEVMHKIQSRDDENGISNALPIQDYLLSSDEEEMMKAECNNSPLLDKIVQGDKIVDELDALTTKRTLKRPLPPHRDLSASALSSSGASTSSGISVGSLDKHEHKKRKLDKRESSKSGKKSKEHDSKYRKLKEKFRCEIAGIIVHHLKPYRKESCIIGRIKSNEDFNHLARKLTHFVMIKELKYCESVGQTLVVTESVKNKSREFIKKYMAKYGDEYIKPSNDPEFKDIPFTL